MTGSKDGTGDGLVGVEDVVEGAGLGWIGVGAVSGAGSVGAVAEGGVGWRSLGCVLVGADRLETVCCGRRPKP